MLPQNAQKQSLVLPAFFNSKDAKKIHALVPTVYFVLVCFHFTVAENSSPSSESQTLLPAATFSQLLFKCIPGGLDLNPVQGFLDPS